MWTKLVMAGTTILVVSGYVYFVQKKLEDYAAAQALQTKIIKEQEAKIVVMEQHQKLYAETLAIINADLNDIRNNSDILVDKLQDSDLKELAKKRSELIEGIINRASTKAFRCFELLSGAELTEQERKATSAKEFNSECPWLYSAN